MWKYAFAAAVTAGVIGSSVYLYRHRDRLFMPDVHKVGGTRIVFAVVEGEPDDDSVDRLRRRFDPRGRYGVVVHGILQQDGCREVEFLVPNGKAHDGLVDRIKRLAWRPGEMVIRPIASAEEDKAVSKKVLADFSSSRQAKAPLTAPPAPPVNALGAREFAGRAGESPHRYGWKRLGPAVLPALGLDPTSLSASHAAERVAVYAALEAGSVFSPAALPGGHALAARLPGSADPAFFVLTREPEPSLMIGGENIHRAEVAKVGSTPFLRLQLDREGTRRLELLSAHALPTRYPVGALSRGGPLGFLAVVVDGEVVTVPQHIAAARPELQLPPGSSDDEAEEVACLIRGEVGVRLGRRPIHIETIPPSR